MNRVEIAALVSLLWSWYRRDSPSWATLRLALTIAVIVWLPMALKADPAPQVAPSEPIIVRLPDGNTAHLENPQVFRDRAGVIFAATRPSSGVGGLVWKVLPDGHTEIIWAYDPDEYYALGEFQVWDDGYLYYAYVQKEDHTFLKVLPVPGWTP